MITWKVWYDNNTSFTNEDCIPEDLPVDGVQIVMEYHSDGTRMIHQGCDYYGWSGESWMSGNQRDLDCWLRKRPISTLVVINGRWASRRFYEEITSQAMERKE